MAQIKVNGTSIRGCILAGILISILALDLVSAGLPDYFNSEEQTSLVSVPRIIIPLRIVGKEPFGGHSTLKMLTAGYQVILNFELLKKGTILESSLQLSSCLWNVFYVNITYQAP